jgi:hypothetical protein
MRAVSGRCPGGEAVAVAPVARMSHSTWSGQDIGDSWTRHARMAKGLFHHQSAQPLRYSTRGGRVFWNSAGSIELVAGGPELGLDVGNLGSRQSPEGKSTSTSLTSLRGQAIRLLLLSLGCYKYCTLRSTLANPAAVLVRIRSGWGLFGVVVQNLHAPF